MVVFKVLLAHFPECLVPPRERVPAGLPRLSKLHSQSVSEGVAMMATQAYYRGQKVVETLNHQLGAPMKAQEEGHGKD
jgi:hypothetical protein